MNFVGTVHSRLVFSRRVRVLAKRLAALLPPNARVLDVGCGDGSISSLLAAERADVAIEGIDVLVRPNPKIPVMQYNGADFPFGDGTFDAVLFVDVLHHVDDPGSLIKEAKRVAKQCIVIKDHLKDSPVSGTVLRLMDWVGNAHHGVRLPYNYWSTAQWRGAFKDCGVSVSRWETALGLYPPVADWIFGRNLHFIAKLEPVR